MTDPVSPSPSVRRSEGLAASAVRILETGDPTVKAEAGRQVARAWRAGEIKGIGAASPPARPSRPDAPALRPPREVKKRKITAQPAGRIALLHALAHIELNAIDLSWDAIARFTELDWPLSYFDDWVQVADEESKHFLALADRLKALESHYGALPAHDGLWQAAENTAGDALARLAIVPLVLEARGLDVTPPMVAKMHEVGDPDSADILQMIHDDEISHVAVGKRWFDHLCAAQNLEPISTWQNLVRTHFKGGVKPPFNIPSRDAAGFSAAFYGPLGDEYLAKQQLATTSTAS
ncbi:MAG: ferritin-like domain-containing protein [Alphaproteobacteria bacterium]|nr:ferritin-like domain-containing protein [Alphaproteobacteria bacterium]